MLHWHEKNKERSAVWRSESGLAAPRKVVIADDTLSADAAHRLACEGTSLLWRGDFQNARLLLQALMRRQERDPRKSSAKARRQLRQAAQKQEILPEETFPHAFHLHRQAQAQRARVLSSILIELQPDYVISLRRAPDLRQPIIEGWGKPEKLDQTIVTPLRELLGLVGAHEWRKKGVEIEALGIAPNNRIHPHYAVFSPVRAEYVGLVAEAPLPAGAQTLAYDIGVGTGVLTAVLSRRGVKRIVATDMSPRAIACARENLQTLGCLNKVELLQTDLFPAGRAPLVVCNPPWVPAKPSSALEHAIYDEGSRMLRGFLGGVAGHLTPDGEAWLILSDLAEHLALRSREELMGWIDAAGLKVVGRLDAKASHGKVADTTDALHAARAAEVTTLWRLALR
ncbi:methyltransferase [Pantoea sp. 18069]|uniref:methyltransferase n=1 Tax=Pantoea sp. 18069 TaxID=2681415 RepID=UPI001359EB01|nr:class I SAM-dependent methyltransferase [Pantoea sp. 18069]